MAKKGIYAIYKGDEFLDLGTAEELAKKRGIGPKSIQFMMTPTYRRRIKNQDKRLIVIRLEED